MQEFAVAFGTALAVVVCVTTLAVVLAWLFFYYMRITAEAGDAFEASESESEAHAYF